MCEKQALDISRRQESFRLIDFDIYSWLNNGPCGCGYTGKTSLASKTLLTVLGLNRYLCCRTAYEWRNKRGKGHEKNSRVPRHNPPSRATPAHTASATSRPSSPSTSHGQSRTSSGRTARPFSSVPFSSQSTIRPTPARRKGSAGCPGVPWAAPAARADVQGLCQVLQHPEFPGDGVNGLHLHVHEAACPSEL